METLTKKLTTEFSGPVLFNYVWWVLREAMARGIGRLYFLARDGYTLRRIAEVLCEQFQLDISLEYLYCSRASLRMPCYHFIGEEAYDQLLNFGAHPSLRSILLRAELSEVERQKVYLECGLQDVDEKKTLTQEEFLQFTGKIRQSLTYYNLVMEKSKVAYIQAVGYLRQCGLFEENTVAIVDSGWAGSMQRSLRQLMEFAGYTGHIVGFYFGMYTPPKVKADGTYLTWYFNCDSPATKKMLFSNNLFECLLSAPHGMTTGYTERDGRYVPVMKQSQDPKEWELAAQQSDAIRQYAIERCKQLSFTDFSESTLLTDTKRRVKRYMVHPTEEISAFYGQFLFCDDVTEAYHSSLASAEQRHLLKNCGIMRRLGKHLFGLYRNSQLEELFWPYGVLAFLPTWSALWNRWNIYIWEWIKYTITRCKLPDNDSMPLGQLKQAVEPFTVVSFDIFDTLVYRVVNNPTDVFNLMEPEVKRLTGVEQFSQKRIEAEKTARNRSTDEDVTLEEIYAALDCSETCRMSLMRLEQQIELQVLRKDTTMAALLQYCLQQKKQVYILSDMYQSEEFLTKVMESLGIEGYQALYSSSSEKATKASGSLYKEVALLQSIPPKQWVHIGDNWYSDYEKPVSLGIKAIHYDNGRYPMQRQTSIWIHVAKRIKHIVKKH